jgi:DNA modification methylase
VITSLNATELQLPQKVDLILTSPPYCNRIDPAVQYGPENYFLSALGHTIPEECLVSITKVKDYNKLEQDFEYLTTKSKYACKLLTKIKESKKADDPSYYLKYYTRYFAKLFQVIDKVLSNLSTTGKMYIVTQDNTHRGQLIEIDRLLTELLKVEGWKSRSVPRARWPRHHLGLRNPHARKHGFVRPKLYEKITVVYR